MRALACLLALAVYAPARIFYVAPAGNDADAGTLAAPWKTLAKAAASAVAGDTVYFRGGTYNERLVYGKAGTAASPILFASRPGEKAVLDGTGLPGSVVHLDGARHVRIQGLEARNARDAGIRIQNASHVTAAGNRTYNTVSSGILVSEFGPSEHIVIDGNEVELACNDGAQECISVARCAFFAVTNNHVHHGGPGTNGGEGIDVKFGSHDGVVSGNRVHHLNRQGIYVDAWTARTYNIDVFANVVHDVVGDGFDCASEQGGLLENIRVFNNVAYNNALNGFAFRVWGGTPGGRKNIRVFNNTFHNNGHGVWGPRGGISVEGTGYENCAIVSNSVSGNRQFQIYVQNASALSAFAVSHNLIDGFRGASGEIRGTAFVEGNPLYAAAASGDFRLQANSPAIDKGLAALAPAVDFSGIPRPQGQGVDIGAHEWGSATALRAFSRRLGNRPDSFRGAVLPAGRGKAVRADGSVFRIPPKK